MPPKLTHGQVKTSIEDVGDELISEKYINNKELLKIKCGVCDENYEQTYDRFKRGHRHQGCSGRQSRRNLNHSIIKKIIEDAGDELISEEYINNKQILTIKCGICSENYKQNYAGFMQGYQHKGCREKLTILNLIITNINQA